MQDQKREVKGGKIHVENNSSSLPDSRSMNSNSFVATESAQSPLFHITALPPKAVVNIQCHTLIAPNSTLARAIVIGNQESVDGVGVDNANK
jgi:hypothetical protein